MKLKYKDFEFFQNPQKISVKKSKSIGLKPLPGFGTAAQEICDDAAVIKISGRFYGHEGEAAIKRLYALQSQKHAGALLLPGGDYFNAFSHLLKQRAMPQKIIYRIPHSLRNRKRANRQAWFAKAPWHSKMKTHLKSRRGAAFRLRKL